MEILICLTNDNLYNLISMKSSTGIILTSCDNVAVMAASAFSADVSTLSSPDPNTYQKQEDVSLSSAAWTLTHFAIFMNCFYAHFLEIMKTQ